VNLALTLVKTGQVEESMKQFKRAVELESDPAAKRTLQQEIAELFGRHD
jgi:hypothetical protein